MAQGDSVVSICNAALIALGEDVIVALTDNTKRAILCNAQYDQVRREVLRRHPWSCAQAKAQIAASTTPPAFGRRNAFQVPADFIRLWDLDDEKFDAMGWELVGDTIQTDDDGPLNLVYVCDLQDTTRMDALLVRCISLSLAVRLAKPLTQSDGILQGVKADLAEIMPDARLVTSQESSPKEWDEDVWLRARHY